MKNGIVTTLILALMAGGVAAANADDCLECHRAKTPAAVRQWQESAHGRAKVGCAACHGTDHALIEKGEARVSMKVCGGCHPKALAGHTASRHGMGLHSGWGCTRNLPGRSVAECRFCHDENSAAPLSTVQCARFLKQTSEMGEAGCNGCHSVESSCASCHTSHMTDLKIVRDPASCAKCHMGPDHPQWEMWQTSLHGTLFGSAGPAAGPTCQTCHMAGGSHNVSVGITMSSGVAPYAADKAAAGRTEMLAICSGCHAPAFARRELARGDVIRDQSLAIVKEAESIIKDLNDRSLLDPMPDRRPPHPLSGAVLVTDSQLLYEDTSHIERLLFKMKKYDLARTVKGVYHQNPAYAHWYGNAELKMDLVDIRSEANRLRERGAGVKGAPAAAAPSSALKGIEERLGVLKKKLERGDVSAEEYEREKRAILREAGGER
jgi:multi-heme cytochrome with CxxCH motif